MGKLGCRERTYLVISWGPVPRTQISRQPKDLSIAQSSVSGTVTQVPSLTAVSFPFLLQRVKSECDCRVHPHLPDVSRHCLAEKKGPRNPGLCVCLCTCSRAITQSLNISDGLL